MRIYRALFLKTCIFQTTLLMKLLLNFTKEGYDVDMDAAFAIKIKLFKIVDSDLDDLFKKEAFHQNTLSTNSILEEELDGLEENFTVDEGFDFIMNEELNDISYKQNQKHKHIFLYDNDNTSIKNALLKLKICRYYITKTYWVNSIALYYL